MNRSHGSSQMNRSHGSSQVNRNHSGNIARNDRPSNRPSDRPSVRSNNRPSDRPSVRPNNRPNDRPSMRPNNRPNDRPAQRPGNSHGSRPGSVGHGPHPGHGPAAVHSPRPSHRAPIYSRPYLEPRYRPVPSYRYGYHYFGHRIHSLPIGYSLIRVGYRDYYYYDGIYYRPYWDGGYYVCRPPLGTRIASTLFDIAMTSIAINTIRNEIERAQYAAELSSIYAARNADYTVRTSDDYYNSNLAAQTGQEYYYQDGVFYTLKNGEYCVIEAPIGALVEEIPEDYDEVELGGKTYYQVEDTLFKPTIIDGKLLFEVVCNL